MYFSLLQKNWHSTILSAHPPSILLMCTCLLLGYLFAYITSNTLSTQLATKIPGYCQTDMWSLTWMVMYNTKVTVIKYLYRQTAGHNQSLNHLMNACGIKIWSGTTVLTIQLPVSADLTGDWIGRSGEEEVCLHCAPINSGTTPDETNTQRWEIREYWRTINISSRL